MSQESNVIFGTSLRRDVPVKQFSRHEEDPLLLNGTDGAGKAFPIPLMEEMLRRHLLLLGGSGTGKTNTVMLIAQKLLTRFTKKDVMVFFDLNGVYRSAFYEKGDVVLSDGEDATGDDGDDYWNLFNEVEYGARLPESVERLAKAVFGDRRGPAESAADLFAACLLCYIRGHLPPERTNAGFADFIRELTPEALQTMLAEHEDLRSLGKAIAGPGEARALLTLQRTVRELLAGNFAETGTLSMREPMENRGGKKIFLTYVPGRSSEKRTALLLRLALIAQLSAKKDGSVYLFLDGLEALPVIPELSDALYFGGDNGLKIIAALRSVTALTRIYGEDSALALLDGFDTRFLYRTTDAATRNWAKSLFGGNLKLERYTVPGPKAGMAERQREGSVIEDWDLSGLRGGQAILGFPRVEPFLYRFERFVPITRAPQPQAAPAPGPVPQPHAEPQRPVAPASQPQPVPQPQTPPARPLAGFVPPAPTQQPNGGLAGNRYPAPTTPAPGMGGAQPRDWSEQPYYPAPGQQPQPDRPEGYGGPGRYQP